MLRRNLFTFFILFLLVSFNKGVAQNLSEKLPVDPEMKVGKLDNGLTYIIRHNDKPEKKVELRLVVNAGSILEEDDQQGLAHFTEHMAFNGSTHFAKNELVDFLQKIGVQFGADLNAYTGFDETVYILPIPLTDTTNFRKGLSVLQDWAGGVSFDNDQIDGERGVVLEESRLGKGADDRMFRKIYPIQYVGSKYSERLPIGKDSILKHFQYDVIKRFYHSWYRPDNQAIIIVGDIDVNETEQLVKEYFGGLKNPSPEQPRVYATVPERTKSEAMVVTDKEATNYIIEVDYPFMPEVPETTVGDYRNSLVKNLFTSLLNQRFNELVEGTKPPFLYAGAGFGSLARGYEGFSGFAVAGKQGSDTALTALITEIERAKKFGFTQSELDRAKKDMISSMEQAYNNLSKRESSEFVQEYIRFFLNNEPSPGLAKEFDYYKQLLPGISLAEVNAVANSLKKNENIFVSLQGPELQGVTLPGNAALLSEAETAMNAPVKPYAEKEVASELMNSKPAAGEIVSENKNDVLGTTEITFKNGAKVILKPTDFKNDEIIMTSFHKGGVSKYPASNKLNAYFSASAIQQMGVGNFSPTDLTKVLAGKNVSASPFLSSTAATISGSSSVKDFETLLQLTNQYIVAPRKDAALFNAWKDKQKSATQFAMADPQNAFIDTFFRVRYNNNPLAPVVIPTPGDFDKIDLDKILAVYKEQFGDASDFTFIFTGSFDPEKIKPLLATYIGSLPTTHKPATIIDNGLRPVTGQKTFTFKKGTEAKSLIVGIYFGETPYSEDLALKADALLQIVNIKIIEDIREKMGAIYGGGMGGSLNKVPYNYYAFVAQLPCGPQNVDTIIKTLNKEIDSIKTYGPSQLNLDKVKKTWIEQYKVNIKENSYWSNKLQSIYMLNNDGQRLLDYENLVNALTVDDIKAVANKLFNGKNVFHGILLPQN